MVDIHSVETRVGSLEVNKAWCKGCKLCIEVCPKAVLSLNSLGKIEVVQGDQCTGCSLCETMCPDYAIKVVKNA